MGQGRRVQRGGISVFILNTGRQTQAAWDATGILVRLVNRLCLPGRWFVFLPPIWSVWDISRKATARCAVETQAVRISSETWGIPCCRRNRDLPPSPQLYCVTLMASHLLPNKKATLPQDPWSVSKVTWKALANWISISSNSSIWARPDTAVAVSAAERPQKMQKYIKGKKVTCTFFFLNFTKSFSAEAWDSSYFSLNQLFSLNTWTLVCFCLWSERTCLKASSREVQSQMLWFKPLCSHPWKKMRRSSLVWRQR